MTSIQATYDKIDIDCLFTKMEGNRFSSYSRMEDWFREKLNDKLPLLVIRNCEGVNQEISDGTTTVDYSADCTFGKDDEDFTIYYILDNAGLMYVTSAFWN